MKTNYFALYDKVTNSFGTLIPSPTVESIRRDLKIMFTLPYGKDTPLFIKYPDDYSIYRVGEYNQITGHFHSSLEFLFNLSDLEARCE